MADLPTIISQLTTKWSSGDGRTRTWVGNTITYSFPDTSPTNGSSTPSEASGIIAMTALMKDIGRMAFELWDDLIAINLTESANDTDADITFNYSTATNDNGTYARLFGFVQSASNITISGSQIWLSGNATEWPTHNDDSDFFFGGYGIHTYLHEIGHSLGLSHPGLYNGEGDFTYANTAEYAQDTRQYTVMSYFQASNTGADHRAADGFTKYGATPLLHDILAIQSKYGADMTTRTGDTVYGFNNTSNRDVFDFTKNTVPVVAIWDAGGIDTIDVSGWDSNQTVDLEAGAFSSVGARTSSSNAAVSMTNNLAVAYGATIENAIGGAGSDFLYGNGVANTLTGGAGNDWLDGRAGADTLIGGEGGDTYVVDNAGDVVTETGATGTDTVRASISYTLGATIENGVLLASGLTMTGNAGVNVLTGSSGDDTLDGGAGADTLDGGLGDDTYVYDALDTITDAGGTDTMRTAVSYTLASNIENAILTGAVAGRTLTGNASANVLTGSDAADTLLGGEGVDTLNGGLGGDTLDGGLGADVMAGGAGDDAYTVDDSGDTVTEAADAGTDLVTASASFTLGANVENLTLVGGNLNGTGNALNNIILGTSGANVLNGGAGADTLNGGDGDDSYVIDNAGDVIVDTSGFDTVFSSLSYTMGAGIERAFVTVGGLTLTGNALGNVMGGSTGDDILNGGAGADFMQGWLGDDTYFVDNAQDNASEGVGEGFDTVYASVSYTLTANVERGILTAAGNLVGNALGNLMGGSTGNDLLNGGAGADRMEGWLGDDIYIIDDFADWVFEAADQGFDSVFSSVSWVMKDNIERAFLTVGGLTLTGNSTANIMGGSTGDDILNGAGGADLMEGWLGDDIYFVDNTLDRVVEAADQGFDTVYASFNYTLGANIERGYLSVGGFRLNGNATGNVLGGSTGNDILDGGLGADLMEGWLGDDIYFVDSAADVVIEHADQGFDTIYTAVNLTLGANFERGYLTTGGRTLTGNATGNVLGGSQGDDVLIGGGGADLLEGWTGVDTFRYLAASDSTTAARDVLGDFQVGVDKIDLTAIRTGGSDTFAFEASGANTILNVDLGGDGSIDLSILVRNATITASDLLWDPAPSLVGEPQVMTAPPAEALDVTTEVLGGPGELFDFGAPIVDEAVAPIAPASIDGDPLIFVPAEDEAAAEPDYVDAAPLVTWDAENGWIVLDDAPSARGWHW